MDVNNPTPTPTVLMLDASVFDAAAPTSFTDLDLSALVGARLNIVLLKIHNNGAAGTTYRFRENGEVKNVLGGLSTSGTLTNGNACYVLVATDAAGIIEWMGVTNQATEVFLIGYWRQP